MSLFLVLAQEGVRDPLRDLETFPHTVERREGTCEREVDRALRVGAH